jgi:methionyl-tRNA synthetase
LPALLSGAGYKKYPDKIISSEYVTLEGKKISTSNNWAVWVPDIINRYDSDLLRYFFISNGPEKRDTDFSWRELINKNNGELLGAYGNLVNRTLVFVKKYFENKVPRGKIDEKIKAQIESIYITTGENIEKGNLKTALEDIFEFVRTINKYFDEETPWVTINNNIEKCCNTIYNCLFSIINISNLLHPFLPESSQKVKGWYGSNIDKWECIDLDAEITFAEFEILFERLDKKLIEEELAKLQQNKE